MNSRNLETNALEASIPTRARVNQEENRRPTLRMPAAGSTFSGWGPRISY